jgi:ABC-2 type transport system ATP-binding protein
MPRYGWRVSDLIVAVRGMSVGYGKVVVLEDIDLIVAVGEVVAVTGVNGAGKSTLLSCLAGLRRPASGTVSVLGGPPRDAPGFWRAVALVAEQPSWYPGLTAREHLELVQLTHQPAEDWWISTDELIDVFGLAARADAMPADLSSGQRQRLSLAAALARPSRLLLLDEPEQSLDAGFRRELAALLRYGYAAHGGAVVMATHDLDFAAAADARRLGIAEGKVSNGDDINRDSANDGSARHGDASRDDASRQQIAPAAAPAVPGQSRDDR